MFTKSFWVASFERAIKSAAQAIIGAVGQDALGIDLFDADFAALAGVAGGGFLLSILTSITSSVVSAGPSLAPKAEVDAALEGLDD